MLLIKEWEMFHTDAEKDMTAVNQISIDVNNKRFVLDIGAMGYVADEYVEGDEERVLKDSTPVSRFVFDSIVSGVKAKGFKELITKNN